MIGLGLGIFKLALSKLSSIAEVIGQYFYDFTQQNTDGFVGAGYDDEGLVIEDYLAANGSAINYFNSSSLTNDNIKSIIIDFYTPSTINNSSGGGYLFDKNTAASYIIFGELTNLGASAELITYKHTNGGYYVVYTTALASISAGHHTLKMEWTGSAYQFYLDDVALTTSTYGGPSGQDSTGGESYTIQRRNVASKYLPNGFIVKTMKILNNSDELLLDFRNKYGADETTYDYGDNTFTRYVGDASKRVTISLPSQYRIENESPTNDDYDFGNALEFASSEEVTFTPIALNDFTYSVWFYQPSAATDILFTEEGNVTMYSSPRSDGAFWIRIGVTTITASTEFSAATWNHLVVSRVDSTFTIYGNGVSVGVSGTTSNTITIDRISGYTNASFDYIGKINDLIIKKDFILTEAQVLALYNRGKGVDPTTIITAPNRYYDFNESADSLVLTNKGTDESADGTLVGFTTGHFSFAKRNKNHLSPYTGIVGDFDGVAAKINLPTELSLSGEFTLLTKFNTSRLVTNQCALFGNSVKTINYIECRTDPLKIRIRNDEGIHDFVFPELSENTWYVVILVRDSSNNLRMYLNGVESTTGAINNVGDFDFNNLFNHTGLSWEYKGKGSDVLAINSSINLTQVQQLAVRPELTKNYLVDTVGIDWADVAAFYPLCENGGDTAYDMSDNKNHGTWTNPAYTTLQTTGRQLGLQNVSRYSTFDGVNDVVNVSTPFTLSQGTIAFWFMPQQHNYNRVIGGDGSNNSYINPQIGSSKVLVRIDSNLNQMYFTDPLPMVQGQWYHIAVTFNSTTANCFVNGIACQENPFEIPAPSNTFQVFNLGRLWQNATYGKQILDDVAVWDVELTQSNIAGIFGGNSASDYSPENLQLYYKDCFINSQGVFKDISGNNNDGIPNGDMETIILPEKETIANIPYDTFGLECNSQRIIINGNTVEETFALRGNGNVRYDGHAGSFVDIKQIQLWLNPKDNTDLNYLMVDEANNAIIKMVGNQILSDFALTTIYIDNVETDVVLNNVWQQVTIEFTTAQTINEFVMGSDYANTPGTFEEFSIDKLNLIKE